MIRNTQLLAAQKALHARQWLQNSSLTTSSTIGVVPHYPVPVYGYQIVALARPNEGSTLGRNVQQQYVVAFTQPRVPDAFEAVPRTAFEELAGIRADNRKFLLVVDILRNTIAIPDRIILADRMRTLLSAYEEDYGESLDAESLRTFVAFMLRYPKLKRPIITATPGGNVFAEWKGDSGPRYLGVHFLPTRQVRYVAIRPNLEHPHYPVRSSGLVTADQLLSEITSHNVLDWAGRSE